MIEKVITTQMDVLGIPYQYWEFEDLGEGIPECYFVGEKTEDPVTQEDGRASGLFILSGWSSVGLTTLFDLCESIKRRFLTPLHVASSDGAAVIEYSHKTDVPSDVDGMCRIEINLNYYEWSN